MRKWILWILFSMACLATMGCHRTASPESVAREFLEAMRKGDRTAAEPLLTKKAQEQMRSHWDQKVIKGDPWALASGETQITGEKAEARFKVQDNKESHDLKVTLRLEEGAWRVYGLAFPLAPGIQITLDFENPEEVLRSIGEAIGRGIGEGMREMGKGLGDAAKGFADGLKSAGESLNKPGGR